MGTMILYEDTQLLVCKKAAGIPVQSARIGVKDMVSILKNYRKETEKIAGEPYLGLVHRLDQPVEGVMVFAKTKAAAAHLSRQVLDGRMKKQYLAVVCGKPADKEGHLVDNLLKDGRTNTSKVVPEKTKGAKRAELCYRVRQELERESLLEIDLLTGRHHQIRVQLSHAGIPIAGDRKYNPGGDGAENLALAAWKLSFFHPVTKKELIFEEEPTGIVFGKFR